SNDNALQNGIIPRSYNSRASTLRLSSTAQWIPLLGTVFSGNIGMDRGINDNARYNYSVFCGRTTGCRDTSGTRGMRRAESNSYSLRFSGSTTINLGRFNSFIELRPSIGGDYRKTQNNSMSLEKINLPPGESGMLVGG